MTAVSLSSKLRRWLPPDVVPILNTLTRRGVTYQGGYSTWAEAAAQAGGYDQAAILEKAIEVALAARDGNIAFERDGAVFANPQTPYPLMAALLRAAAVNEGRLAVIDFGGALGSTWFQCRPWLQALPSVTWTVVEQPHYVAAGRERLASGPLGFADTMEEAARRAAPDIILFSGVLQYLSDPWEVLRQTVAIRPGLIVVDRTPFIEDASSLITVQHVPARIVKSSYPARLFALSELLAPVLSNGYEELGRFDAVDGTIYSLRRHIRFQGIILTRR
jgi:putative methyltransferase (TIGR04325 family)